MIKRRIFKLALASGVFFCQSTFAAEVTCRSYTIVMSDGYVTKDQVCFMPVGGTWNRPDNYPAPRFGATGGGSSTIEQERYVSSEVDPDGDGNMNCYKNLTESSNDNYDMDSKDLFAPNRVHPVTGDPKPHNGIDIQAASGTPANSMAYARVSQVGLKHDLNGNFVRLAWKKDNSVFEATYIHLTTVNVAKNDLVTPGSKIGTVGETGLTSGPHLHLQLKQTESFYIKNSKTNELTKIDEISELIDPLPFLGGKDCIKL